MRHFLHDLFFPHIHNNYRSKLLHHRIIFLFVIFLFAGSFFLSFLENSFPKVLGVSSNISNSELLLITNQKRQEKGLEPLVLNDKLNKAAEDKATDMFAENYWAHNSPTGKTPWVFIKGAGYPYVFAGENLARGFSSSQDVVNAWMASPEHRENMLSKNYNDVGFAVKKGNLVGEDTVLIVEMLGSSSFGEGNNKSVQAPPNELPTVLNSNIQNKPLIDSISLSKNFVLSVVMLFLLALFVDMIITERKKVTRFVGHNVDHILFFSAVFLIVVAIARGTIL